ncbi:MAG TPA: iron-containing redox enzyme family protein [Nocardioidaceae bacterium]|nr:iron-containing redox enzyme family protein [Nocardioidaceae bacterium]
MQLPVARGPLSGGVIDALAGHADLDVEAIVQHVRDLPETTDLLTDDDFHLALWVLYELHYGGFEGVDPELEWDPDLLRVRAALEQPFEAELRRRAEPHVEATVAGDGDLAERLFDLSATFEGPSVSKYLHREATLEEFAEFMVHRSVYQLKESDPHSWVIPRITGRPKAALVELQYDEYGGGRPERLHATMFGDSMEGTGLDRTYGAYLDRVPGYTLANNNVMSLFGLHRRLRGAAMGHLGAYEATSSIPCRKYAQGVRRLGLPEVVAAYFDEHVEADAVHEQLAFRDICAALVTSGQAEARDVVFGVVSCLLMDAVVGEPMLDDWQAGRSTLRGGAVEVEVPPVLEAVAS